MFAPESDLSSDLKQKDIGCDIVPETESDCLNDDTDTSSCFEGFDASDIVEKLCSENETENYEDLDAKNCEEIRESLKTNVRDALKEIDGEERKAKMSIEDMKEKYGDKFIEDLHKTVRENVRDALESEDIKLDSKELKVVENI